MNRYRKEWLVLILFAFALHFGWEMFHSQFYAEMMRLPFWTATRWCLRAALVDTGIMIALYVVVALIVRHPTWPGGTRPLVASIVYVAMGIAITAALELWATRNAKWTYASQMPTIVGVGLLPLLQWLLIPVLVLGTIRRYLVGSRLRHGNR